MHTRRHRGSRKTHRRRTRGRNTRIHRRHKGGIGFPNILGHERVKDTISKFGRLSKVGSAIPNLLISASQSHPKIQIDDAGKEVQRATQKLAQLTTKENERRKQANKDIDKEKALITLLRSKISGLKDRLIKKTSQSTSK